MRCTSPIDDYLDRSGVAVRDARRSGARRRGSRARWSAARRRASQPVHCICRGWTARSQAGRQPKSAVLIGLSGGVDSAVAAMLLREQGRRVTAATLRMWPSDDVRSCCSDDAPAAGARLRSPARAVVRGARRRGALPAAHRRAVRAGVPATVRRPTRAPTATGSVWPTWWSAPPDSARSAWPPATTPAWCGVAASRSWRGPRHARKDQSYMLWRVASQTLAHLEFPLGELTKEEVRRLAEAAGLPVAQQPESQDVCFATAGYRQFLRRGGVALQPGDVVDRAGRVLGRHDGQWAFTVASAAACGWRRRSLCTCSSARGRQRGRGRHASGADGGTGSVVRELTDRGLHRGVGLLVQSRLQVRRRRCEWRAPAGRGRAEVASGSSSRRRRRASPPSSTTGMSWSAAA